MSSSLGLCRTSLATSGAPRKSAFLRKTQGSGSLARTDLHFPSLHLRSRHTLHISRTGQNTRTSTASDSFPRISAASFPPSACLPALFHSPSSHSSMARHRSCSALLVRHCHVSSTQALASLGYLYATVADIMRGPYTLSRMQGIIQRNYFPGTPSRVLPSASLSQSSQGKTASSNGAMGEGSSGDGPWLIVGLGNPGPKYEGTRHNIGFELVDALSREEGIPVGSMQCKAAVGKGRICGTPVVLAKPQTFMNVSGESVAPLAKFYKIPPARVLVMYDDLDLDVAAMKILAKGGHGGHNGMRSIIDKFGGDKNFPRLRFGIGRPPGKMATATYVLHRFTKDERYEVDVSIARGVDGVRMVLGQGLDRTVSQWNQSKKQPAGV